MTFFCYNIYVCIQRAPQIMLYDFIQVQHTDKSLLLIRFIYIYLPNLCRVFA